jgi:hypothetical protein
MSCEMRFVTKDGNACDAIWPVMSCAETGGVFLEDFPLFFCGGGMGKIGLDSHLKTPGPKNNSTPWFSFPKRTWWIYWTCPMDYTAGHSWGDTIIVVHICLSFWFILRYRLRSNKIPSFISNRQRQVKGMQPSLWKRSGLNPEPWDTKPCTLPTALRARYRLRNTLWLHFSGPSFNQQRTWLGHNKKRYCYQLALLIAVQIHNMAWIFFWSRLKDLKCLKCFKQKERWVRTCAMCFFFWKPCPCVPHRGTKAGWDPCAACLLAQLSPRWLLLSHGCRMVVTAS